MTVKPVLAESLTIDPESWNGEVGETFTITAAVWPDNITDKSLAWASTDEPVATVDAAGNVTTVGEGTCSIEATTLDGSGLKVECVVVTTLAGLSDVLVDADDTADVYTTSGILIKCSCTPDQLRQLAPGFYIIRQGQTSKKVLIKP